MAAQDAFAAGGMSAAAQFTDTVSAITAASVAETI
jgi:hypothetical protein